MRWDPRIRLLSLQRIYLGHRQPCFLPKSVECAETFHLLSTRQPRPPFMEIPRCKGFRGPTEVLDLHLSVYTITLCVAFRPIKQLTHLRLRPPPRYRGSRSGAACQAEWAGPSPPSPSSPPRCRKSHVQSSWPAAAPPAPSPCRPRFSFWSRRQILGARWSTCASMAISTS